MATRSRRVRPGSSTERASDQPRPQRLSDEERLRRRALARRRVRRRRIGALGALLAFAAAAVLVVTLVTSGGASPTTTAAGSPNHAPRIAVRHKRKPVPPPQLPRGGRTLLPGHLIVAFYGIPGTSNVLGKTGNPESDAAGLEQQAHAFRRFGRPVQPAFELVTTFASPDPGPDGSYSAAIPRSTVQRYLAVAHRHKLLLILDFQPGRGEFLPEVRRYASFLVDPSVGVALDPEWKLTSTQYPDEVIGSAAAGSINAVSAYLARLVTAHRLPQKLLIVHEFQTSELPDRQHILFRHGLAMVLQMDGLGAPSTKLESYHKVMRGARGFFPGFKVFLRPVDDPVLLLPAQIMRLHPRPDYVSYQ